MASASFTNVTDLFNQQIVWFQTDIPPDRLKGDSTGRQWYLQAIGYTENLQFSNLNTITNRNTLNDTIANKIQIQDVNQKQGICADKVELAQLYSFQKSVIAREKTRLQYYRDDMSQKGKRNMYTVKLSYGEFALMQTKLNQQSGS